MAFELPAETFIVQKLRENFPDIDIRSGTAFRDMLITPQSYIIQPFRDEVNIIKRNLSLQNYSLMLEDEMDMLVANVFVSRREGSNSTGTMRLYTDSPQDIQVTTDVIFATSEGLSFSPDKDYYITAEEIELNTDGVLYYYDIQAVAADSGIEYNVDADTIIYSSNLPDGIIKINNPYAFAEGVDEDTNEELYSRAKYSISVRDLVSKRSIIGTLYENISSIVEVFVVGFGDEEMQRDVADFTIATSDVVTERTTGEIIRDDIPGKLYDTTLNFYDSDVAPGHSLIIMNGLDIGEYSIINVDENEVTVDGQFSETILSVEKIVDEVATAPTGNQSGNDGWRVLIDGVGTGDFQSHDNKIATWDDGLSSWSFDLPIVDAVDGTVASVIERYADEVASEPTGNQTGNDGWRILIAGETMTGTAGATDSTGKVFTDTTVNFVTSGVEAGEYVIVDDVGVEIVSVDSTTQLTLADPGFDGSQTGLSYAIRGGTGSSFQGYSNKIAEWNETTDTWSFETPVSGQQYFIEGPDTGGHDNDIATWDGTNHVWLYTTPYDGYRLLINGEGEHSFASQDYDIAIWDTGTSTWSFSTPSDGDIQFVNSLSSAKYDNMLALFGGVVWTFDRPSTGWSVLVDNASGEATHQDDIAKWTEDYEWIYLTPSDGWELYDKETTDGYVYSSSNWNLDSNVERVQYRIGGVSTPELIHVGGKVDIYLNTTYYATMNEVIDNAPETIRINTTYNRGEFRTGESKFYDIYNSFLEIDVTTSDKLYVSTGVLQGTYEITAVERDYLEITDGSGNPVTVTKHEEGLDYYIIRDYYRNEEVWQLPIVSFPTVTSIDPITDDVLAELVEGTDYEIIVRDENTRYSSRDDFVIKLLETDPASDGYYIGATLSFTYYHDSTIASAQAYVDNELNRVLTADLLCKTAIPSFVDLKVAYKGDVDEEKIENALTYYIQELRFDEALKASDIIQYLQFFNVTYVEDASDSIEITADTINIDGSTTTQVSTDYVKIPRVSKFIPRDLTITKTTAEFKEQ